MCRDAAGSHPLVFRQSNYEGEIVGWIHEAIDADAGIVINPAGLTFTSIPILDALKMSPGPIVELHISNIHRREAIYHTLAGLEGRDRGHRRPRRPRLPGRGPGDPRPARRRPLTPALTFGPHARCTHTFRACVVHDVCI